MDLTVIILNWNTRKLLRDCLQSVVCQGEEFQVEVIVVDNASEDGSREMVLQEFPQVRLVVNSTNIGFGAGNNSALPYAAGRYVLFLNSDTIIMDQALAVLVRFGDAHPDVGILGPKLLNGDGSLQYSCRRYPNLGAGFFRSTPLGKLFPNNRFTTDYLLKDWDHSTPRDVDWVSGAALMIRRTLIDRIGCFDEDYYMYCEDVDLCWRVSHTPYPGQDAPRTAAPDSPPTWRVTYVPDAVIYHLIGKSSDQAPTRMTYEFHHSQYIFFKKHYEKTTPFLLRLLIPVGISLRAFGQMSKYQFRHWSRRLKGQGKPMKSAGRLERVPAEETAETGEKV